MMAAILLLNHLSPDIPDKEILLLLTSFIFGTLLLIYRDFTKTYVKRPSHFVPRSFLTHFRSANFDAPLIELRPEETYREALQRGSALVRYPSL